MNDSAPMDLRTKRLLAGSQYILAKGRSEANPLNKELRAEMDKLEKAYRDLDEEVKNFKGEGNGRKSETLVDMSTTQGEGDSPSGFR